MMEVTRPKDLVFTLFGEYLLERAAPVWVGSLISLLAPFGLSEGGVRTVLSRMTKKGWLHSARGGRHSFYELTPKGRRLLEKGQARIFHPSRDPAWDGTWFLLAYSIPQDSRDLRDRLRDRLAWLGFGSIGNGLWISPHDVAGEIEELSDRMGLGDHMVCFRAHPAGGSESSDLVSRCWDLEGLNVRYRTFVRQWAAILDQYSTPSYQPPDTGESSFVLRFNLIHEFRSFPLDDPYLPRALLPTMWAGDEASDLFLSLHDLLVGSADAYVDEILAAGPVPLDIRPHSSPEA